MKLQIGERQPEVRLAVVALQLQCGLKILGGLVGLAEIVQHETAIDISGGHFRIALKREREVLERRVQIAIVRVHVAGNQREIFVFGEDRFVFRDQRECFVVAAEVIEIVGEVIDALAIIRELLNHFVSQLRRLRVVAFEGEIAFAFALAPARLCSSWPKHARASAAPGRCCAIPGRRLRLPQLPERLSGIRWYALS